MFRGAMGFGALHFRLTIILNYMKAICLIFNNIIQEYQLRDSWKDIKMLKNLKQLITMCLLIIGLLAESNITNPEQPLKKLMIYNQNYDLVYPTLRQVAHQSTKCGIKNAYLLNSSQKFIVSFNQPFIVIIKSEKMHNLKVLGYAQSVRISSQLVETEKMINKSKQYYLETNSGNETINHFVATIPLSRECVQSFTYSYFNSIIKIYEQPPPSNDLQLKNNYEIGTVNITTLTYCTKMHEIIYLQSMFNSFYLIVFLSIVALIPTFPIKKILYYFFPVVLILNIFVQGFQSHLLIFLIFNTTVYYLLFFTEFRYQIPFEYQIECTNACQAFFSIVVCYDFMCLLLAFNILFNNESGGLYLTGLYLQNIISIMGVFALFGCVFWLNRFKHLFWWMVAIFFILQFDSSFTFLGLQNILYHQIPYAETSSFITLFIPPFLAPNCQTKTLFFQLLLFPVCTYSRKMMKTGLPGILIMVTTCIFTNLKFCYWCIWVILILTWLIEICSKRGVVDGVRRTWVDRSTLNWLR